MAEEMINQEQAPTVEYLLAQIAELKENTVSKEKYDGVMEDYRTMADAVMNGQAFNNNSESTTEKKDYNAMANEVVFGKRKESSLEYVTQALAARKAALEQGVNINMPFGPKAQYSENDEAETERIAAGLQWCVDQANGDPDQFNLALNSIMIDNMPMKKGKIVR